MFHVARGGLRNTPGNTYQSQADNNEKMIDLEVEDYLQEINYKLPENKNYTDETKK
jgi:hypothetical protein